MAEPLLVVYAGRFFKRARGDGFVVLFLGRDGAGGCLYSYEEPLRRVVG